MRANGGGALAKQVGWGKGKAPPPHPPPFRSHTLLILGLKVLFFLQTQILSSIYHVEVYVKAVDVRFLFYQIYPSFSPSSERLPSKTTGAGQASVHSLRCRYSLSFPYRRFMCFILDQRM